MRDQRINPGTPADSHRPTLCHRNDQEPPELSGGAWRAS
jgi:hypothetical protein